jgi:hypothetical protein
MISQDDDDDDDDDVSSNMPRETSISDHRFKLLCYTLQDDDDDDDVSGKLVQTCTDT